MPIDILMPALSPTMEKGNLAKWLKKEGDKVAPGDVIAEIETDKATMEVEAIDEGVLARIVVPEGSADVPVNQLIAVLATEGEDAKAIAAGGAAAPAKAEAAKAEAPKAEAAAPAAAPTTIVLRPLLPREELFIVRSACGADIRTLCAGVAPGGGRIMQCISNRAASLSPACRDVLAPFAAR